MSKKYELDRRRILKNITALGATASISPAWQALAGDRRTAVVVGSGIAGLSAAYDLQEAGFAVTVFEKRHMAGGRMRLDWMGPLYGEVHAEEIWEGNLEMNDLAEKIGIAEEFTVNQPDGLMTVYTPVNNGDGPYGVATRFHMTEVLATPGFSDKLKQDLLKLLPDLAEIRATVDPCLLHTGAAWDDESLFDYLAGKLGKEGARRFTDDWVAPGWLYPWGQKAEQVSKIALLSIVAQQDKRWINPRDTGLMTRTLASLLNVEVNTTVMRITPPNATGRHTVHYLTSNGQRSSITPDVVVCATEGNFVMPMVQELSHRQKSFFNQVHLQQDTWVTYILKKGTGPKTLMAGPRLTASHPGYDEYGEGWVAFPETAGGLHGEVSSLGTDYKGRAMVVSFFLDNEHANAWRDSGLSLADFCMPVMQKVYPDLTWDKVDDVVVRGGDGLVMFNTGLPTAMAEFIRHEEKETPGLYFCGEYLSHAHTGAACASGRMVARTITKHWT